MASCINITVNSNDDDSVDHGAPATRVYAINGRYHELEVSHAFEVTMSDTATVATVTIDSMLHDRVVFHVDDGTLKIGLKPGTYSNIKTATVTLPLNTSLDDIELTGASRFTSNSPLAAKKISIDLCGASYFNGDIKNAQTVDLEVCGASHFNGSLQPEIDKLDVELTGASTAIISGTVNVLDIDLSGASNLDAGNLDTKTVNGDISGASTASVLCCDAIKVDVSGASHLTYSTVADGCTPVVDCHTSGASTVKDDRK
ncbi:MAG: DUF2807 domain-containing protein [Bacteroidales bacterium]|nr:DUF2807 domain-containing protein [Bacteroidales bacterium]